MAFLITEKLETTTTKRSVAESLGGELSVVSKQRNHFQELSNFNDIPQQDPVRDTIAMDGRYLILTAYQYITHNLTELQRQFF